MHIWAKHGLLHVRFANCRPAGGDVTKASAEAMRDIRKSITDMHRSMVALDIKVKKWSHVPAAVSETLRTARLKSQALQDFSTGFLTDSAKFLVPEKMQKVIDTFAEVVRAANKLFRTSLMLRRHM